MTEYDREKTYALGVRRLKQMLPSARAEAAEVFDKSKMIRNSSLAKSASSYFTEENMDALIIYPAPEGGWHADLVFTDIPAGYPAVLGSPVGNPCKTRVDAFEMGRSILVMFLADTIRNKNKPKKVLPPVFILYDVKVTLQPDLLIKIKEATEKSEFRGLFSFTTAVEQTTQLINELFPGGESEVTVESIRNLDAGDKARLMSCLHVATLHGLYTFPPRVDKSPSGDGPILSKIPEGFIDD